MIREVVFCEVGGARCLEEWEDGEGGDVVDGFGVMEGGESEDVFGSFDIGGFELSVGEDEVDHRTIVVDRIE